MMKIPNVETNADSDGSDDSRAQTSFVPNNLVTFFFLEFRAMLPVLAVISAAFVATSMAMEMPPNPAPWPDQFTVLFNVSSVCRFFKHEPFPMPLSNLIFTLHF